MKGFILNGAMFRVLATRDVLQAHHVFGNWGSMYAIWESADGWHAAIKITGSWNKLRREAYKTEQQTLDDAIEHNNTSASRLCLKSKVYLAQ
ncbi:hypothetical protein LAD54_10360 [Klebsiella pneumoniae]|uniref:hypothetical protein n=1 Tax=Klebsiella pneumoniae TaxID=573 RepID=UPI00226EE20C|nr:hypothetical protein [Klebsiella pneumoniae]MCX9939051.1 hypothetical protein [Klebsiella pneumoniae]MCY0259829.1 hypothetical protein [Klebsiella pneumoniae]